MVNYGGSANIRGILYQILGAIDGGLTCRLKAVIQPEGDVSEARLVLEPRGGGDLRVDSSEGVIVEQWKSRQDQRSWSLAEIAKKVLPDLLRALRNGELPPDARFRFVTEGRAASWLAVNAFFRGLDPASASAGPESLDDTETKDWGSSAGWLTDRGLFEHIEDRVLEASKKWGDHTALRADLWRLLCSFEIQTQLSMRELERAVAEALGQFVAYREHTNDKLRQLEGWLLEGVAKHGEFHFTPEEALSAVGASTTSIGDWERHKSRSRECLAESLRLLCGYAVEDDVRSRIGWSDVSRCLVVAGGVGQGKSWRIAALANELSERDALTLVIRASGDAEKDLDEAGKRLGRKVLDRDEALDLEVIERQLSRAVSTLPTPWLYLLVDDTTTLGEVRQLIEHETIASEGIALAVSTSAEVGGALEESPEYPVSIEWLHDFAIPELREFFKRQGLALGDVDADLRPTLRRPVLASTFVRVLEDGNVAGVATEAELLRRFWEHRVEEIKAHYPQDFAVVGQLLQRTAVRETPYPWTQLALQQAGVDDARLQRFLSTGWFVRAGEQVRVLHDRFFNYALAATLPHVDADANLRTVLEEEPDLRLASPWHLGVDLLSRAVLASTPDAKRGAEHLRELERYWRDEAVLYRKLLPSLGAQAAHVVAARLESVEPPDLLVFRCAEALGEIGRRHARVVDDVVRKLLWEGGVRADCAMVTLSRRPVAGTIDVIWERHRQLLAARRTGMSYEDAILSATIRALSLGCETEHAWLRRQLRDESLDVRLRSRLLEVLAALRHPAAREIWNDLADNIIRSHPAGHRAAVLCCVLSFRDLERLPFLELAAREGTRAERHEAIGALALLAPESALTVFRERPGDEAFYFYGGESWVPQLLVWNPRQVKSAILQYVCGSSDFAPLLVFSRCASEMDRSVFASLLAELERSIATCLDSDELPHPAPFERLLDLAAKASAPSHLDVLQEVAGANLEQRLAALATRWIRGLSSRSTNLSSAMKLLLRMDSPHLVSVVNEELASADWRVQLDGLDWARVEGNEETSRRLKALAAKALDDPEAVDRAMRNELLPLLAKYGLHESWIELKLRSTEYRDEFLELRKTQPALTDQQLKPVVSALSGDDPQKQANASFVVAASGRNDLTARVEAILKSAPDHLGKTRCALFALSELQSSESSELVELALQHSVPKDTHWHARRFLDSLSPSVREEALIRAIHRRTWTLQRYWDDVPWLWWSGGDRVRGHLVELVATAPQDWYRKLSRIGFFDIFADPRLSPTARDRLWEDANTFGLSSVGRAVRAARALWRIDREGGYLAAERGLFGDTPASQATIPDVLVQFDPTRAVGSLCARARLFHQKNSDTAAERREWPIRMAVARALRLVGDRRLVSRSLRGLVEDEDPRVRRSGFELLGWQGPYVLKDQDPVREAILNDPDWHCRRAAWACLKRQRDERRARALLANMPTSRRAVYARLLAVIDLVDPILLRTRGDKLNIEEIRSDLDPSLRHLVDKAAERAEKKLERG